MTIELSKEISENRSDQQREDAIQAILNIIAFEIGRKYNEDKDPNYFLLWKEKIFEVLVEGKSKPKQHL